MGSPLEACNIPGLLWQYVSDEGLAMSDLLWYVRRFRRMPVAELPYRFEHWAKKKRDKHSSEPMSRNGREGRYRIQTIDVAGVEQVFPDLTAHIMTSAESILHHHFHVFGIDRDFGDPIDWHLDPKTGRRWPLAFWGDIDYRDGRTVGGIKFAWELNRLQHLPVLALAFRMRQDRRYRAELFTQLQSWIDGNPYPRGINWISGIEIGIRIVNVVYSLRLLGDESLDVGQREALTRFVLFSGRHLYRYHSRYSSCANHAVAEGLGLFAAGLCLPGIEGAARWKMLGKSIVEHEVTRQIYPDGSSFEHSVPYLLFVSELCLVYLLLCRDYDEPCSPHVSDRLKVAFEFMSQVTDGNGNFPSIGDGDDGCLLKLDRSGRGNLVSLLNIGAVLFDKPEWILPTAEYDLLTFCLLGRDSTAAWKRLKRRVERTPRASQRFADAGLVTIADRGHILFVGNGGRLGLEPLAGHGHADCLSFWLSVKGHPIVVDPGTYLYHSGGPWRVYFRGTSAHSTVVIDEQDQAPGVSDFMFGRFYDVRQTRFDDSGERVVWSVEHDGYARLSDPVIHRRTFTYTRRHRELVIEDLLVCKGSHSVRSLIHLHPDCLVSLSRHSVDVRCGEAQLTVELDPQWGSVHVIRGQQDPRLGWYSPRFNEIHPSPAVVCCKNIKGTMRFASIIRVGD